MTRVQLHHVAQTPLKKLEAELAPGEPNLTREILIAGDTLRMLWDECQQNEGLRTNLKTSNPVDGGRGGIGVARDREYQIVSRMAYAEAFQRLEKAIPGGLIGKIVRAVILDDESLSTVATREIGDSNASRARSRAIGYLVAGLVKLYPAAWEIRKKLIIDSDE